MAPFYELLVVPSLERFPKDAGRTPTAHDEARLRCLGSRKGIAGNMGVGHTAFATRGSGVEQTNQNSPRRRQLRVARGYFDAQVGGTAANAAIPNVSLFRVALDFGRLCPAYAIVLSQVESRT